MRPGRWVTRILAGSGDTCTVPSRRGRFVNNLVWCRASDPAAVVDLGPGTEPATFGFAANLWFAEARPGFDGPVYPPGVAPERGAVIQRDPGFVDVQGRDYRLARQSPAARRGLALPGPALYDFARRSIGGRPAIGAYLRD